AGLKYADCLHAERIEQALRDRVIGELLPRDPAAGGDHLGSGVVDRNLLAGGIDPLAEVAVVHFGRGHGRGESGRPLAVPEAFVSEKEECLILPFVELRDPDWTARAEAEIVLLINGSRSPAAIAEKAVGVEVVVSQEFIGAPMKIVRAGLGRK